MKHTIQLGATLLAATLSTALWAQNVEVQGAWARATVQGQMATGAFMKLTAKEGARRVTEVHEMVLVDNVMKMRALPGLDLPAGKLVELKPGGYHVMLLDLKAPLQKDTTIPMTLVFKDAKGVESKTELKVPVNQMAPMAGGMGEHK
jgi:periplasmic copper chaperone A